MTIIRTLALATLLASALVAQPQIPAPPAATQPKAPEPDPDPAVLKAMRSKVIVIQHRDPFRLQMSLGPLASGTRGARMMPGRDETLSTITVRDFPENLAAIEEAIKRLDVPLATAKSPDVELTIHVLFASRTPAPEGDLPPDLQGVVKQLKGTLAYRSYALAATYLQRLGVNADRTVQGRGQLDGPALLTGEAKTSSPLFVDWESDRGVGLETAEDGASRYLLRKFQFWLRERRGSESEVLARMETGLTLKDGEKVVVGTTVVKDRGLVVVLSARKVE